MKRSIQLNDLLISQLINLPGAGGQSQPTGKKNAARVNRPTPKMVLKYSAKRTGENHNNLNGSKFYIKNMVSIRCEMVVRAIVENLGLHPISVKIGEVEIEENISAKMRQQLNADLQRTGLELIDDTQSIMVEKIRNVIVEMIHSSDELPKIKTSAYISEKLHKNYTTISNLFSEVRGMSIEHYVIAQKIERAKELITYGELTISEIAYKLNYSSGAHLCTQFKDITGLTPSYFKKIKQKKRNAAANL